MNLLIFVKNKHFMLHFTQTWPWYFSGFLIGIIMLILIYFGKTFGMSSNFRSLCSIVGAGKYSDFFRFDWKKHGWNLVVVLGAMVGGYISVHFLSDTTNVSLSPNTLKTLTHYGIDTPKGNLLPNLLFGNEVFTNFKMIIILLVGGFLIGFGSRYAGGCTSGHAIQGLSNLQLPSLKAAIGFFIGGLIMVHLIFPLLF